MTDKQIIIDCVDVSGCKCFYINDSHPELQECINPFCKDLCKNNPSCYYKQFKRLEKLFPDIIGRYYKAMDDLKAKEQECEELMKTIIEAKNSKLDLKSFLVGEAVQNEYEQQLDQLKAELTRANCQIADDEILQCDMREAIEELKAENEELKAEIKLSKEMLIQNTSETNKYTIPQIIKQFISDNYIDRQDEDGYTIPIFLQLEDILYEKEDLEEKLGFAKTSKELLNKEIQKLRQILTEIKEIAEKMKKMSEEDGGELTECFFTDKQCEKCSEDKCLPYWFEQILQKISEVENDES